MSWEWHITESNTGEESPWITITDSSGNWIAEIPDDDRIEDARLIAAAPQLLEACEVANDWLGNLVENFPHVLPGETAIGTKLQEAIAAAKGGSDE